MKLENFVMQGDTVKIVDFGISTKVFKSNGDRIEPYKTGFQGTVYYASVNTLNGWNGFQRDDLESLGYTFMQMIAPEKVPWRDQTDVKTVLEMKTSFLDGEADPVFRGA